MSKIAIIGAGNADLTIAAQLKLLGKEVSFYDLEETDVYED